MKIQIVERQPVQVVCLRYTGPYGEPLGRFWRHTVAPWLADHGLVDCPRYGVALDDPAITPAENCRYDACVELPAALSLPEAAGRSIAGGRYAIACFKGTAASIGAAWADFFRAATSNGSHPLDPERLPMEHYPRGAAYDARTGIFCCELCLPLDDRANIPP